MFLLYREFFFFLINIAKIIGVIYIVLAGLDQADLEFTENLPAFASKVLAIKVYYHTWLPFYFKI